MTTKTRVAFLAAVALALSACREDPGWGPPQYAQAVCTGRRYTPMRTVVASTGKTVLVSSIPARFDADFVTLDGRWRFSINDQKSYEAGSSERVLIEFCVRRRDDGSAEADMTRAFPIPCVAEEEKP